MELVEGEALDARIKAGPIPVEEALKLALQIAEALEAAHEKGVIHRDLKPANIKITPDEKVKVLDFGLAKAFAQEQTDLNLPNSPTLSVAATQQGVILGTAAYMSPEQARGKAIDKRTDIWAFGCVLYEMLSGQAAFQGEDVTEILAAVVKMDVNLDLLPEDIHPGITELLLRCLQKEIRKRYADIADVRYEIEQVLSNPGGVLIQPAATGGTRISLRHALPWALAVFILGLVLAGVTVWNLKPPETRPITRFGFPISDTQNLMYPQFPMIAVSPDGRQFVYISNKGLYWHSMDTMETRLLVDADEDPITPFFSYDGQWVGYMSTAESGLKKISINRGTPQFLCNASSCLGASWGKDNRIVYSTGEREIRWISANGAQPETLIDAGDALLLFHPRFLPEGKSLLYTVLDLSGEYQIAVQSLESEKRKVLFPGDCAWYLPTRHLVYTSGNNLFAVPFDPVRLEAEGDHVQIGMSVFRSEISAAPQYAVSESGTLIYVPGMPGGENVARRSLVWIDVDGKEEPVAMIPNAYADPQLSPDGNKAVMVVSDGMNTRLWIWDFIRENLTPLLAPETSHCIAPIWSPDGKRIVYSSCDEGKIGIYSKAWNGTGETDTLYSGTNNILLPSSWADNDGKTLLFWEVHTRSPGTIFNLLTKSLAMDKSTILSGVNRLPADIGMLLIEDGGEKKELLKHSFVESLPQISPDGKCMAYVSNESGELEIWLRPFPDVDKGRCKVSTGGADSGPMWSPTGQALYYRSGDSMMVVDVGTDPINNPGRPSILFQSKKISAASQFESSLNIHPDTKRFLMLNSAETGGGKSETHAPGKINVVLNWTEELKQRVPVK